jgi:hypothetical protein
MLTVVYGSTGGALGFCSASSSVQYLTSCSSFGNCIPGRVHAAAHSILMSHCELPGPRRTSFQL